MRSLGLDIGGANTKAALVKDGEIERHWYKYIPLWRGHEPLAGFLEKLSRSHSPQAVAVTMTGELSDVFGSKREGVEEIVSASQDSFKGANLYFLSLKGKLISQKEALASPSELSASNWVSSSLLVGREHPDCLMVDAGSTTTDLIPIEGGKPSPGGWTDYERLATKELVYTGVLRTPLPYLRSEVSVEGRGVGIAAEYFAIMADVYRVLNVLDEEDYTCETPDGRGRGREGCMRRIARVFCSDLEEVGEDLIVDAAESFYEAQVSLVRGAIEEVTSFHEMERMTPIVVTGIGREILGVRAAREANFDSIIDLADIHGEVASLMTPAFGLALMVDEVARS